MSFNNCKKNWNYGLAAENILIFYVLFIHFEVFRFDMVVPLSFVYLDHSQSIIDQTIVVFLKVQHFVDVSLDQDVMRQCLNGIKKKNGAHRFF